MKVAISIGVLETTKEILRIGTPEVATEFPSANLRSDMSQVFQDRNFVMVVAGFILVSRISVIEAVGQPFMDIHF